MSSTLIAPWGDIQIHAMPSGNRLLKVTAAVQIDGKTVFKDAAGKLYSPSVRDKLCYPIANWGWTSAVLKGLVALGEITKKQADEYKAAADARARQVDATCDLDTLDRIAARHGIKIAAGQRAKLLKAAGQAS